MKNPVPLRRVARLAYGDALPADTRVDGEFPIVGSGGPFGTHESRNFGAPGIVIGRKGSHGAVHWVAGGGFATDTVYFVDRTCTSSDLRWLYYAMQAMDLRGVSQDVGVPGLSRESAYEALIPQPPSWEEQRRIADFLDAEVARIGHLSALQAGVRDKLGERHRILRDSLVNNLARSVGEVPLRRFITRIEQGASPQCDASPRQAPDEWGVLKLSAVKAGRFYPTQNKRLPDGVEAIRAYEVKEGDLLVTRANTPNLVGDVTVVTGDSPFLLLPDLIYRVTLSSNVNAQFVAQVALSGRVRTLIESTARGSSQSMVKLRGEDIKEWPVPQATLDQQRRLVRGAQFHAELVGKLQGLIDRQLKLLAERRQALITAAVTGEFDVSSASGRGVTEGLE